MNKQHTSEKSTSTPNKFKVGDHVGFKQSSQGRNHFIVAEVLAPGQKVSDDGLRYPGWSIKDYRNDTGETVYVLPDGLSGITFAARESEIELIVKS